MNDFKSRKVLYRTADVPDFDPNLSDEEILEKQKESKEQFGRWHAWTQVSEEDSKSDNILIKAYGVIETLDGELLEIPIQWFKFIKNE